MIALILTLALCGFLVYLVTTYIPMPPIFKTVIYAIVTFVLILYVLRILGIGDVPIPRL